MHEDFTPPTPLQLRSSSDEQLIGWVRAAQAAGHEVARERALEQLIGRYATTLLTWNLKVPEDLKQDLAHDILVAAVRGVLDGKQIGTFRRWLAQVARNQVADFWRGRQGEQLKTDRGAAAITSGEEGEAPEPSALAEYGERELWMVVDEVLADLGQDSHRQVIELFVFEDLHARDVGAPHRRVGGERLQDRPALP